MSAPTSDALLSKLHFSLPVESPAVPHALERTQNITSKIIITVFPPGSPQKYFVTCIAPPLACCAALMTGFCLVGYLFWKTVSGGKFSSEDFGKAGTVVICTATGMFIAYPTVMLTNEIYESYVRWKEKELKDQQAIPK